MAFHWSLSDSKTLQLSRTLLSILAVLSKAEVWMVSTPPPICKSSSPLCNSLVTVPKAPSYIIVFFSSLARSRYLSFFSHSFSFILWSSRTAKSTILQALFFCWSILGLVFWLRLGDQFLCQSPIGVYVC